MSPFVIPKPRMGGVRNLSVSLMAGPFPVLHVCPKTMIPFWGRRGGKSKK